MTERGGTGGLTSLPPSSSPTPETSVTQQSSDAFDRAHFPFRHLGPARSVQTHPTLPRARSRRCSPSWATRRSTP
ncbi:hypothetical protein NKG05_12125 [Oerskovia sp. M15]